MTNYQWFQPSERGREEKRRSIHPPARGAGCCADPRKVHAGQWRHVLQIDGVGSGLDEDLGVAFQTPGKNKKSSQYDGSYSGKIKNHLKQTQETE